MRTKSLLKLFHLGPRKSASTPAIHSLPVEILQEIFSYLDIHSLSRCCSVCARWNECIPGSSLRLHSIFCFESVLVQRDSLRIRLKYTITTHVIDKAEEISKSTYSVEKPEYGVPLVQPTACGSVDGGGVVLNPAVWYIHKNMQPKLADVTMWAQVSGFDLEKMDGRMREEWPPEGLRHLREAFATAPPVRHLDIDFHYHDFRMCRDKWEGSQRYVVANMKGVRLEDLWMVFEKRVEGERREHGGGRKWRISGFVGC